MIYERDPEEVGPESYEDIELRMDVNDSIHDFDPDPLTRRCRAHLIRHGVQGVVCGSTQSHSVFHNEIPGCCYCKHGVYLHTDYDIPCGACEMGEY